MRFARPIPFLIFYPMRFVRRLLQESGLPVSPRQFWWYAAGYWAIFGVINYWQAGMLWLMSGKREVYYSEHLVLAVHWLLWFALTPLILYAARRVPLAAYRSPGHLGGQLLRHLVVVTGLHGAVTVANFLLVRPLFAWELGRPLPSEGMITTFLYFYTTAFAQYMLLIVIYNVMVYVSRYERLRQQHLQSELTNEQLKSQLTNALLEAMNMQLNPHFLFNTLHSVVSLMAVNETRKAGQMVTALSDLLRSILARQTQHLIPLREELQLTRQYLSIQQIRFQDRLRVEYEIAPETEAYPVPQLILQPLVENAITHGVAGITADALIRIRSGVVGDTVRVDVFDNGLGVRARPSPAGTGLGLKNILSRLQQTFGAEAQLRVEQPPEGSTTVSLLFPRTVPLPPSPILAHASCADH